MYISLRLALMMPFSKVLEHPFDVDLKDVPMLFKEFGGVSIKPRDLLLPIRWCIHQIRPRDLLLPKSEIAAKFPSQ